MRGDLGARCIFLLAVQCLVTIPAGAQAFRRGDATADGRVDLGDPVFLLDYLFRGGATPSCRDAADVDDNGNIDLTDSIGLLNWLFAGGSPPPGPGPSSCASDPTADALGCASYPPALCAPLPPRTPDSSFLLGFDGPALVEGPPGGTVSFDATARICNEDEVSGWSLGFTATGCTVQSVTTKNTVADNVPEGMRDQGFEKSEVLDPSRNGGLNGGVSTILLSLTDPVLLPVTGIDCEAHTILAIRLQADVPEVDAGVCALDLMDGLVGSGQPLETLVTHGENPTEVAKPEVESLTIQIAPEPPPPIPQYRRGDANADSRVDLDDAVFIVDALFRGGEPFACEQAADANGDANINVSDSVYLFQWRLRDGPPPPSPGPFTCGPGDPLHCLTPPPGWCDPPGPRPTDPLTRLRIDAPAVVDRSSTFQAKVLLDTPHTIAGLSLGIETTGCVPLNLAAGSALTGYDLFIHWVGADSFLAGIILDTDGSEGEVIAPGTGLEVLDLTISADPSPASACVSCELVFVDGRTGEVGEPFDNFIITEGQGYRPLLVGEGVPISAPLEAGAPQAATLAPCALFKLSPPFSGPLTILLSDTIPGHENALYFRWGEPPTADLFDHAAAEPSSGSQRLVVPSPRLEDAYILATALSAGENDVTIQVMEEGLALERISASYSGAGGTGRLGASITGAGFDAGTRFRLEPSAGGAGLPAAETTIVSSSRAEAVFELSGAPEGVYDLEAASSSPIDEARLERAFTVTPDSEGPRLEAELLGADQGMGKFRYDRISRLTLRYRNTGDAEMTSPIFKIAGPPETEFRLAWEVEFRPGDIQVLGIHPGGFPGRLPPGGGWEIPIEFKSKACRTPCIGQTFELSVLTPLAEDIVGWDDAGNADGTGLSAEDWREAWPGLSRRFGSSWREYHENLADLARTLAHRGAGAASVGELFRFAVREAYGRPSSAIVGEARTATGSPAAGVHLLAYQGEELRASALTDGEGAFALDWLRAGVTYHLAAAEHAILDTSLGGTAVRVPDSGDLLGLEVLVEPEANGRPSDCPDCDETRLPEKPILPPARLFTLIAGWECEIVSSWDPNEKEGPEGEDRGALERLVAPGAQIDYTIRFENHPRASAPAVWVVVTDFLDPSVFDVESVHLRDIQIGSRPEQRMALDVQGKELSSGYTRNADLPRYSALGSLQVLHDAGGPEESSIEAEFHVRREDVSPEMTQIVWEVTGLTGDLLAGFLPANCAEGCDCETVPAEGEDPCKDGRGEGYVSFSVNLLSDLPEGTVVENEAAIEFDGFPIEGGSPSLKWMNIVSHFLPPSAPRDPEPKNGTEGIGAEVTVRWSAAGAQTHDVYLWPDGAPRGEPVAAALPDAVHTFRGLLPGTRYRWQVRSVNADGDTLGPEWMLATAAAARPCPPQVILLAPEDGTGGLPQSPLFDWELGQATAESIHYKLYVWRRGEDRPDPVARGFVTSEFTSPLSLDPGTEYHFQVAAFHPGCETESAVRTFTVAERSFQRGDPDGSRDIILTDAVFILNFLFLGGRETTCLKSADADDNGSVDLTDAVFILNFLFLGGREPPPPWESCGEDPTPDQLGCREFPPCA